MYFLFFLILVTCVVPSSLATDSVLQLLDDAPVLHFTLSRRGGVFATEDPANQTANLTYLTEELYKAEARFNLTRREMKGNKLIRKAKEKNVGGRDQGTLMGEVGKEGVWYAKVGVGNPRQELELDLNMLVSDFYVITTSSRKGSRYDPFFSQSNIKSSVYPYPSCNIPTDSFHLPTLNDSVPLSFALCRPSKSSLDTLRESGCNLGLAPSDHLSQTKSPTLLNQLLGQGLVERPIMSLMLINSKEGVLSIGGTSASAVDLVQEQTRLELDQLGALETEGLAPVEFETEFGTGLVKRGLRKGAEVVSRQANWEEGWKWSKVQGAEGWWQILMQGVWVEGSNVIRNQPVVIDINTPFILAPPAATNTLYASISGSRPLPPPYSHFHTFPCLNAPSLAFEFAGWSFPAMRGAKGADWNGMPGGKFSLGRLREGSGYCVGAVVETRMGMGILEDAGVGGNGLRDVWVLGERFFRGVGAVFDFKEQRVGFRTY